MQTIQNAIDGRKVTSTSPRIAPVYNPATGEQTAQLPLSTVEDVNAAVGWGTTPVSRVASASFGF
jgi:malonate-semialdehyde dehydrogenase (acetylating)/methylmalonate-semialdehyde dehydrogenase